MSEPNSEQQRYAPPMAPDKSYVEINAYVIGWGLFFAPCSPWPSATCV